MRCRIAFAKTTSEQVQKSFSPALFMFLWLTMIGGGLLMQLLAIKWVLKTKWSDFRLIAVPVDNRIDEN